MEVYLNHYFAQASAGHVVAGVQGALLVFALVVFLFQGVRLSVIDIREHRLPDRIVLPLYLWVGIPIFLIFILSDDFWHARQSTYSAVFLMGSYWILRKASRNALGLGDVKLAGIIGLICGFVAPLNIIWATLIAFVLGGLVSVALVATRKAHAKTHIPFGPFMLIGATIALFIPA